MKHGKAWTQAPRETTAVVVTQVDEDGCGPACAAMLLADRGCMIDPRVIAEPLALPVDGPQLAARMSQLSDTAWLGGALDLAHEPSWELLAAITDEKGSWAALLERHGPRHVGHWVVVDGVSDTGRAPIRDPVGHAYGTPVEEFLSLWRYTVLVMEGASS
jgi:hypothetical protein